MNINSTHLISETRKGLLDPNRLARHRYVPVSDLKEPSDAHDGAVPLLRTHSIKPADSSCLLTQIQLSYALGESNLPFLIKCLADKDPEVSRFAAMTLAKCAKKGITVQDATFPLIKYLEDHRVRLPAVVALKEYAKRGLTDSRALIPLTNCLGDEDNETICFAARALTEYAKKELTHPDVLKGLIDCLERNDDEKVLFYATDALACYAYCDLTDPDALPLLFNQISDLDPKVRNSTARALTHYGRKGYLTKMLF